MIPEIELQRVIDSLLKALRADQTNNGGTPSNTILHYLLSESNSFKGKYNFYDQAVEIFSTRGNNHPRYLDSRLFFDRERAPIPTIHIMANGENNNNNGLGVDQGFQDVQVIGGERREVYNRHFDANFSIVISSDNSMETIVIYHVIKSMLISIFDHVQLKGFVNPQISGRDINISQDVVPSGVFARAIDFKAGYELPVPTHYLTTIINKVIFEINPIVEQNT